MSLHGNDMEGKWTRRKYEMKPNETKVLTRALGLPECITITAGAVIGVGLFTTGSSQVGIMGPSIIVATIIAFLLVLWPAAIYGEMAAALPLAGGTYAYAKRAINYPVAVFCSWNYTVAQIGIGGAEALAFANYWAILMEALGISWNVDTRITASALFILFVVVNYFGIEFAGKWQNISMYFFWGVSIVWFMSVFNKMDFSHFTSPVDGLPGSPNAFAIVVLMVWWCFAGFETVVGMGAEVKFPKTTIPRALCLAPFIVFSVNTLFQWFLVGLTPPADLAGLATADAPFAFCMNAAGIVGIPVIILCLGITFGGDFSTMNPCVTGPARYMYVMANDGNMPKVFGKLHPKYNTPYISILVVGVLGVVLISTGSIAILAAMCAFCQMTCYIIGYISYLMLKKKEPNLERPFKVPFGTFGAYFSIVAYFVLAILALDMNALPFNLGFDAICIIYYFVFVRKRPIPQNAVDVELLTLQSAEPTAEEKAALDKQFKVWRFGAIGVFIVGLLLFAVSYII